MPRARIAQSSFVAGEFSALLEARSDIALYKNGAAKLTNRRPRATGANDTRPGMRYVATLAHFPARLIPFVFSETQRYVFVLSDTRADVFLADGTAGTPITGAPWTAAMLERLATTSDGDTTFLFHPDMIPQVIKRTGATTFARTDFAFETDSTGRLLIPFERFAAPGITLTPSATTGTITLTASADVFVAGHVGVRFRVAGKQVTITVVTNATTATATVVETLAGTGAVTQWDEAAFSGVRGWPSAAAFIDNRLALAGSRAKPTGVWLSRIGAFFNHDLGTALDNEAIAESIAGGQITQVRHLVGAERLIVLGDSGAWFVPSSASSPITPGNISFRQVSNIGAAWTPPVRIDEGVLYLDGNGRVVRELVWSDAVDSYTVDAVSLAAEHLINQPFAAAAYDGSGDVPERLGFYLCQPCGTLAVFHSIRSEKIAAWYQWTTAGIIRSLATLRADVFLIVERTIAGNTVHFLERFDEDGADLDATQRATAGAPTRTWPGFVHLAAQDVWTVSRGHPLGTVTVSGAGTITLPDSFPAVDELDAGLFYAWRIRPMPVDFDLQDGAARGLWKRLIRAIMHVNRAASFRVQGSEVQLTFQGDDFASPAPTVSGLLDIRLLGISREAQVDITNTQPGKVTILGMTREVHVNG